MLLSLAGVFLAFLLILFVFQRRLIYLPTRLDATAAEQIAGRNGSVAWRNTAGRLIGWRWPARGTAVGAVLVVHGNAGSAVDRDYLALPIQNASAMDVFVLEYPGYGPREGSPSQHSLLAAADEAFEALSERRPLYIVSESLGAGVAAHLARVRSARVSGLVLFAPYDSLVAVAQKTLPFLPMGLVLLDRLAPAEWLKEYHGPVFVVLAGADEVIPKELGLRFYDGYAGPKKLLTVAGAHHNDIAEQSPAWWQDVFAFLESAR